MRKYQDVFERYEKKYILSAEQYCSLREKLTEHFCEDSHGLHTINNIYYDTDSFELARASIEKPVYKEKLRLRSYGTPSVGDDVFLELKKKYDGVVFKRRIKMELEQAMRYLELGIRPNIESQILNEIDWFLRSYDVEPKAFIAYDRIALAGVENPELRITFDNNIRWRSTMLNLSRGSWGSEILQADKRLMEIKIPGAMPTWLAHILSENEVFPASFSKYGNCYKQHLMQNLFINGGKYCA